MSIQTRKKVRFFSHGMSGTTWLTSLTTSFFDCAHRSSPELKRIHPPSTRLLGPHTPLSIVDECCVDRNYLNSLDAACIIYADPRNSLISLASNSRNRAITHLGHLHTAPSHIERYKCRTDVLDFDPFDVLDFDPFSDFFNSWLYHVPTMHLEKPLEIGFLKYEKVVENRHELANFLRIPEERKEEYCDQILTTYRPRTSNYGSLPTLQQDKLTKIFQPLLETQSGMGDFQVRVINPQETT